MNPNEKGLIELLRGLEEDGFRGNLGGQCGVAGEQKKPTVGRRKEG